ncbi:hypothetical protein LSH36_3156g00001, partial [Paralvinella palmiformis]
CFLNFVFNFSGDDTLLINFKHFYEVGAAILKVQSVMMSLDFVICNCFEALQWKKINDNSMA